MPPLHSPRVAFADLRAFLRGRSREKTLGAICSLLVTGFIVFLFFLDPKVNTAPPAQIIYTDNWALNRTDAEIIADQQKHQAEREAAARAKQQQYQELANSFGIE
jgi:hypothetical protein